MRDYVFFEKRSSREMANEKSRTNSAADTDWLRVLAKGKRRSWHTRNASTESNALQGVTEPRGGMEWRFALARVRFPLRTLRRSQAYASNEPCLPVKASHTVKSQRPASLTSLDPTEGMDSAALCLIACAPLTPCHHPLASAQRAGLVMWMRRKGAGAEEAWAASWRDAAWSDAQARPAAGAQTSPA